MTRQPLVWLTVAAVGIAWVTLVPRVVVAQAKKSNILVIGGDDVGNQTPNIDRIVREGQPSCTAGRAAFIGGNISKQAWWGCPKRSP